MSNFLEKQIKSVRGLLGFTEDYLNKLELYPRGNGVYLDACMLAILSKSIRVGRAICVLAETDFHSEAFAMSRTMLELSIFARYISNSNSLSRSESFVKYFAKDHEGWTNLLFKYYPNALPNFNVDHTKLLDVAKQFKDPHRWSGKSVKDLAMEEDTFELLPDGSPFRWEFDYEVIYKWTSHYVHGTVVAVDEHASGPRQPFKVKGGPNPSKGDMALFNVALYLHRTFIAVFRSIKHEISDEMIGNFDLVVKSFVN